MGLVAERARQQTGSGVLMRNGKLLLGCCAFLSACNCEDVFLEQTPAPEIEVADENGAVAGDPPLVVDFGDVETGARVTRQVHVRNLGGAPLAITRLGPLVDGTDPICPVSSAEFAYPPISSSQGVAVDKGDDRTVEIAYKPQDGGADCAIMEVRSNDPDEVSVRVYLRARGSAAKLCATQDTLDFGDVVIGQEKTLVTQIGNCGIRPLTLTQATPATSFPPFELVTALNFPRTFEPGEMMNVELAFAPTEAKRYGGQGAQADPGTLLIDQDQGAPGALTLLGRGVTPPQCRFGVTPTAINFGMVSVGSSSSREVLLQNSGDAPCTVSSMERVDGSPDFSVTAGGTPPAVTLGPAQTATLTLTFAPTALGLQRATFSVVSDAPANGTHGVSVEANQPPPPGCYLEADPAFVNFGVVPTGETVSRVVTLRDVGDQDCFLTEISFPVGAADFSSSTSVTPFIGTPIGAGESIEVTVDVHTSAPGPTNGRARFTYKDSAFGGTTQTLDVELAASPQAPHICFTPDPVDFGSVPVSGEARKTLTIQSCGASDLDIRGLYFASGSSAAFSIPAAPGLPVTLPAGSSLNLETVYRPTQVGGDLGIIMVNSDDPDLPSAYVRVLGNAQGLCPPLMRCTPETVEFGNVQVSAGETRTVVCRNYGTQSVTLTAVSVSPAPPFAASAVVPTTLATGQAVTVQVTATPGGAGALSGTLSVVSNACDSVQEIPLTGTAIPFVAPACLPPTSFAPQEEWHWQQSGNHPTRDQVWVTPVVINLTDDNQDGVISSEDVPDVVFSTFDKRDFGLDPTDPSLGGPVPAVLRAVSGDDGHELWTVMPEALMVQSEANLAAGDIDGDNKPDIVASKYVYLEGESPFPGAPALTGRYARGHLLCFGPDGSFKWQSEEWTAPPEIAEDGGAPLIADLDQDGFAEVIYRAHVYNHEGQLKWVGAAHNGDTGHGAIPLAADLDGNGTLELVVGFTAYRHDGSILWNRADMPFDGNPAVADFEADGTPEVVVHNGQIHILNGEDGSTAYGAIDLPYPRPSNECSEDNTRDCEMPIPTHVALADFDADGKPEIAVANRSVLLVLEASGAELWRVNISDQTGASGPAAFDFEGDGIWEVVYSDEQNTFALRGTNGQNIYQAGNASRTIFENPVIADVDHDNHANIVTVQNEPLLGSSRGVKMLSNSAGNWVSSRYVWNQHAYHITNVAESGAIPRAESPHYLGGVAQNSFRAQSGRCQ
jgi:hypothetical protein